MIDAKTSHLQLPLPDMLNPLYQDVMRLRESLAIIDARFSAIDAMLSSDDLTLDTMQEIVSAIKNEMSLLGLKAPLESPTFTGTVKGINKGMVGLGNVDNTSDVDKPVSTAQEAALDEKLPRNLVGAKNGAAALDADGNLIIPGNIYLNRAGKNWGGIQWYNLAYNAWSDYMGLADVAGQGPKGNLTPRAGQIVTTWGKRSFVENGLGYGWVFETDSPYGQSPTIAAEIGVDGSARFTSSVTSSQFNGSGAGLTGTAPALNIGGSAGSAYSARSANQCFVLDSERNANAVLPISYAHGVHYDFVSSDTTGNPGSIYSGLMTFTPYDGSRESTGGNAYQLAFSSTAAYGATPDLRIRNGADTTWNQWYVLLHSGNFTTYSPGRSGVGAYGTWDINITGSAGSLGGIPAANHVKVTYQKPPSFFQNLSLAPGLYTNDGSGLLDQNGVTYLTGFWHVLVFAHDGGGFGAQIATELSSDQGNGANAPRMYLRVASASAFGPWAPIDTTRMVLHSGGSLSANINDFVVCSGSDANIVLPSAPIAGDKITICRPLSTSPNVFVYRNGKKIHGVADDYHVDYAPITVTLRYTDDINGWIFE